MKYKTYNLLWVGLLFLSNSVLADEQTPAVNAVSGDLSIMVLGSGGPAPLKSARASSGYLIFTDVKPRFFMDVGGGTYKSLAESQADIKDIDFILLSHLHIDHTADLSAFIKGMYFQNRDADNLRTKPVRIFGPGKNKATFPKTKILQYPSTSDYAHQHYDMKVGTERYLNIFATAIHGGTFSYKATDIPADVKKPISTIIDEGGLKIKAIAVVHGPAPAVAYRIEYKGKSIVFSGDTSSATDNMIKIAQGADLLIYDTAIMDKAPNKYPGDKVFFKLHTTPSRMGEVVAAAKPKQLVLSHLTSLTESRTDEVADLVKKKGYMGEITVAHDLAVYNIK